MEDWEWRESKYMATQVATKKTSPYLPTCPIEDFEHNTVSSLIDPSTSQWHTDLANGLFVEEDAELIKKIPMSKKVTEDVLYWPFMSNGEYSNKSGYRFLKEDVEQLHSTQVPPLRDKNLWKAV